MIPLTDRQKNLLRHCAKHSQVTTDDVYQASSIQKDYPAKRTLQDDMRLFLRLDFLSKIHCYNEKTGKLAGTAYCITQKGLLRITNTQGIAL